MLIYNLRTTHQLLKNITIHLHYIPGPSILICFGDLSLFIFLEL